MADRTAQTTYTYISQLEPLDGSLLSDDLLVVSHLTDELSAGYESFKLQYGALRDDIYDYVSATMSSATDLALLSAVEELSGQLSALSGLVDICLSACVALDNCRNNVIDKLGKLDDRVTALEHEIN